MDASLLVDLADRAPLRRTSREAAAVALLELGRHVDEALPVVVASLERLGYPELPRAVEALGALGRRAASAAPALERLTDHGGADVREAAFAALARIAGR